MSRLIDITGMRFGRLVALRKTNNYKGNAIWLCKCDCGKEVEVRSILLRNGTTKSCGCFRSDLWQKKKTTHGMSDSRLAEYCSAEEPSALDNSQLMRIVEKVMY